MTQRKMYLNHLDRKLSMDKIIIVGFLLIVMISCEENDTQNPNNEKVFPLENPDTINQLEYDLICESFDNITLQQATNFWPMSFSAIIQEIHDLDSIAYLRFVENNKMSYNLDSAMFRETNIKLISITERDYLIDNPDFNYTWDEFFKKYPEAQGLFTISRVGFSIDSTKAIISYGVSKPFYRMDVINYYKFVDNKWILSGNIGIQTL
ncbi:MAG: hypothetical protein JXB34_08305 [Bacteroidales bacterium]|nr:hypothetical protein [Bacteroidales bacterium]